MIEVEISKDVKSINMDIKRTMTIPAPVDATLSIPEAAADAAAVGAALRGVARSVNGKNAADGAVNLIAADIPYGEQSVQMALDDINNAGYVRSTRTINGKALTEDITLNYADVGALQNGIKLNGKTIRDGLYLTANDVEAVPKATSVNGKVLSGSIKLYPADVGAVPISRKVNGYGLSTDVNLNATDVGAFVKLCDSLETNGTFEIPEGCTMLWLCTPYGNIVCNVPSDGSERNSGGLLGTYLYRVRITRSGNVCTLALCNRRSFNFDNATFGSSSSGTLNAVYGTII